MANKLNVNPTRQELLKLKHKLRASKRGHKLLKEKRDGLMKQFMAIIRQAKALREEIEAQLAPGFFEFVFAVAKMHPHEVQEALMAPTKKISLTAGTRNVMSVHIPEFEYHEEGHFLSYGLASTAAGLDNSLRIFSDSLQNMVKLAEVEHSAKLLAQEIEKTRRRVNALEYVYIPNQVETIKYIQAKLSEQERGNIIALMKVKEIIERAEA